VRLLHSFVVTSCKCSVSPVTFETPYLIANTWQYINDPQSVYVRHKPKCLWYLFIFCIYSILFPVFPVVKHCVMKTYDKLEVKLHAFLTSQLHEGKWAASRFCCFTSESNYLFLKVDISIHDVEEIPLPNSISTKRRYHNDVTITYCDAMPKSRILWRPLLRNGHKENAYFSSNEHISRRYLGNKEWKHVPATTNSYR
jgi:hypothetical protein